MLFLMSMFSGGIERTATVVTKILYWGLGYEADRSLKCQDIYYNLQSFA